MLWTHDKQYETEPFELEADLEEAVREVAPELFDQQIGAIVEGKP